MQAECRQEDREESRSFPLPPLAFVHMGRDTAAGERHRFFTAESQHFWPRPSGFLSTCLPDFSAPHSPPPLGANSSNGGTFSVEWTPTDWKDPCMNWPLPRGSQLLKYSLFVEQICLVRSAVQVCG